VRNDETYIKDAEDAYAVKMTEWKERKRLRTEEIASIEKAIEILTSDEARDTMSSSFSSQTALLQVDEARNECRAQRATSHIRKLAAKHKDVKLAALAVSMMFKTRGHFDEVVSGIDKMISDLHKENDMDLKVKEDCEADRNSHTKMAKNAAYEIDGETALIVRKEAEIDAKNAEIARLTDEKKELNLQRDEATVNRAKEAADYAQAKVTDEAAVALIEKAKAALAKFYTDNNLAFAQVARAAQPVVTAGAPPPPPPNTWSEPYGGNKGENKGIQSIMQMIIDDVNKDIRTATEEEDTSKKDFDDFMSETKSQIEKIDQDVTDLEGEIGDCEMAIKDARASRGDKKKLMEESLMYLRSIAEGCDFMAANFELRKANREAETDGLLEAEAALTGGTFGGSAALIQGC